MVESGAVEEPSPTGEEVIEAASLDVGRTELKVVEPSSLGKGVDTAPLDVEVAESEAVEVSSPKRDVDMEAVESDEVGEEALDVGVAQPDVVEVLLAGRAAEPLSGKMQDMPWGNGRTY